MAFLYNKNENSIKILNSIKNENEIKNENSISFMPKSVGGISYEYDKGCGA